MAEDVDRPSIRPQDAILHDDQLKPATWLVEIVVLHNVNSKRLIARAARSGPGDGNKTVLASALVASAVAAGQRILVPAHSYEIIDHAVSQLREDQHGEEVA